MPYVIRHPGRLDLFDGGEGEYVPLSKAKHFASETIAEYFTEPGEVVMPAPEKEPTHPIKTS